MNSRKIEFLLPLLDDEDEEVYRAVKNNIIEIGPGIIPALEKAYETADNLLQLERIQFLIFHLRMQKIKNRMRDWIHSESKSLEEGWILISSIQGNEISTTGIDKLINQITQTIWLELNRHQTSLEKISAINNVFFDHLGFKGNVSEKILPENFFLDKLLITRTGNQTSLNLLYTIIAQRLNLPVRPIKINKRILLGWYDPVLAREAFIDLAHSFLFFIDVEHKGRIIGVKEFEYLLSENHLIWNQSMMIDNVALIRKLITNLKELYFFLMDMQRVMFLGELDKEFDHQ